MYQEKACPSVLGDYTQPSIADRLSDRKLRAEKELERINKAISALEKNPEIAEIFESLQGIY